MASPPLYFITNQTTYSNRRYLDRSRAESVELERRVVKQNLSCSLASLVKLKALHEKKSSATLQGNSQLVYTVG